MAGIGFELRRVLQKGGLARIIGVSLAGTAVVAGPWLLSVFGIFLIQHVAGAALQEAPRVFSASIVYCYALSLVLMSGLHYAFTRQISDLIYEERSREAASALLSCLLLVLAAAAVLGAAGILPWRLSGVVSRPRLFAVSLLVLFIVINLNWIVMSFVSLLRSYTGILLVYLGGAVVSLIGVMLLGRIYATAGALLGYAIGQLFTVIVLYLMTLRRYKPAALSLAGLIAGIRRHPWLFLAGLTYAWATWAEKIVYWTVFGTAVQGTWMRVFDAYDIPIFFAILTLVPGLVFFTIETETSFYPRLREFLRAVASGTWKKIQEKKAGMIRSLGEGMREQSLLQGLVSVTLIVFAPAVGRALFGPGVNVTTLRVTLAAVFLHSLFLSLMVFLFYLEMYDRAFLATLVFFAANLGVSLVLALVIGERLLGAGYVAGGAAGSLTAWIFLARALKRIERILFLRASG